ncbi:MAG: hypothetical protein ACTSX8_08560, partial [Alphaproteobacteria bacterium]
DLPEQLKAPGEALHSVGVKFKQAVTQAEADATARIAETVRPLTDDADLQGFVELLRKPPEALKAGERLSTYLARQGGVQDFQGELRAIGLPKGRPGLLRKTGLTLDEAGERAFEAGFFNERPTVAELLSALAEDINTAPVFRASEGADVAAAQAINRGIDDTLADFSDLGLDINAPDLPARLREIVSRPRGEAQAVEPGTVRATEEATAEMTANLTDIDGVLLRQVSDDFAGDLDRRISLEDFDGNMIEVRAGDVLDDLKDDAAFLKEYQECLGVPF